MLTVPDAARRAGRDAETIRRWIRTGRLRAEKEGTQHVVDENDLDALLEATSPPVPERSPPVPERWRRFDSGRPQPDWAQAISR